VHSGKLITELAAVVEGGAQSACAPKNGDLKNPTTDASSHDHEGDCRHRAEHCRAIAADKREQSVRCPIVLCVDDNASILALYLNLLEQDGYEVIAASSGRTALNAFHARAGGIDAVILDFRMPGMNGVELAASLKSLEPALPILMISSAPPNLTEMAPFVDAAIIKGSPLHCILTQLELLLAS
jgi:CheY-like chemotaxis protein